MAGRKIRKKPETIAGRIRGMVISFSDSKWDAPQERDASSSDGCTCWSDAEALFMEKDR